MTDSIPLPAASDRSTALIRYQLRAVLGMLLFALALPLAVLPESLLLSLVGALGVFGGGMIAGYQAARMGQATALPITN